MKKNNSSRIVVIVIFVVAAYFIYGYFGPAAKKMDEKTLKTVQIRDDFDKLNNQLWYAGQWLTHSPADDKVFFNKGVASLEVKEKDKGPYLLSRPIAIENYDIIKIRRRLKVHYGSDYFAGAMVVFDSENADLEPQIGLQLPFGRAVVMLEYAHDYSKNTKRPGKDAIRLLAPDWQVNHNYVLVPPIYDKWFDEELVIDNNSGKATYTVNGKTYSIDSAGIAAKYFRIWMHGYGSHVGHRVDVDWLEVTLTSAENEAVRQ